MVVKEFIQMRRDRLTFAMMLIVPLIQLLLFGYAINSDPKHLPAALLLADHGPQGRTLLHAIQNSGYVDFVRQVKTESEGTTCSAAGTCSLLSTSPKISRETSFAARGPPFLLKRMQRTLPRPATPSAPCVPS